MKQNIKHRINLSKIALVLSIDAGMTVVALLILLYVTDNVEIQQSRTEEGFMRVEDYTCREIMDDSAPIGVILQ